MIFDSQEYRTESSDVKKRGALWKEFKEFNAVSTLLLGADSTLILHIALHDSHPTPCE